MNTTLPEMPCQELVEVITDYLEDALPERDRIRFEEHLAVCAKCREYMEQFRRTIQAVGSISEEDLDPQMRESLLVAFRGWRGD
jgi:anti-sigma factor RsiW